MTTGLVQEPAVTEVLEGKAAAFIADAPLRHHIDGEWRLSRDGATGDVVNPSDGSVLMNAAYGSEHEIDDAVQAAHRAFPVWAAMSRTERAVLMHRLADAMERDTETLAQLESLDVGKPIELAEDEVTFGIKGVRYYADVAMHSSSDLPLAVRQVDAHVHLAPYGVCGFIFPWNYPFIIQLCGILPALAAGNTVVMKPSSSTPLTTLYTCKLAEEAGFPAGVLNAVIAPGRVGSALPRHPLVRRMAITGSVEVGRLVGEACGARPIPCKLELGGKGAAIVLDDVDVAAASRGLADAITVNTGQVCCTATRWIVHEKVYDEFIANVSDCLKSVRIGPGLDRATKMGPMVTDVQRDVVLGYIERGLADSATALLEGGAASVPGHEGGFYVSPCLLTGPEDNECFREEIFGPVAYVTTFSNEDDAVASTNSLEYGLANSVWSSDLLRANRVAERLMSGSSWINAHNMFHWGLPFAGINLSGTGSGVYGLSSFYDYLRHQSIARPLT